MCFIIVKLRARISLPEVNTVKVWRGMIRMILIPIPITLCTPPRDGDIRNFVWTLKIQLFLIKQSALLITV